MSRVADEAAFALPAATEPISFTKSGRALQSKTFRLARSCLPPLEVEFLAQERASAHLAAESRARLALRQLRPLIKRNSSRTSGAVQVQKEGEAHAASCHCQAKGNGIARQRWRGRPANKLVKLQRRDALQGCAGIVEQDTQTATGEAPGQNDGASGCLQSTAAGLGLCPSTVSQSGTSGILGHSVSEESLQMQGQKRFIS